MANTLTATIILYPKAGDSVIVVEGHVFALRGRLLKGLRQVASDLAASQPSEDANG